MANGNCAARLAVCVFAALLWLVLAAEARAEDGSASSGDAAATLDDGAAAVDTVSGGSSGDEQDPAADATTDPGLEGTTPVEGAVEQPSADQPPVDQAPPVEPPAPEQPPVDQGPPPEQPPAEQSPPVSEVPPEPPPSEPPVVEPSATPEPPVVAPPPGDLAAEPPLPDAEPVPAEVHSSAASQRESIVTIALDASPPRLTSLFGSSVGDGLAAATWAGDRLDPQGGSRSAAGDERPPAAERAGDAPLLPALPFRDGAPSQFYVSGGGAGGSSAGFFVGLVAGLVALLAAAAQRLGGLVSLALAPPRCTAFVLCLERPD
jgi:outer membrane biosynthesis protein TonB